MFDTNLLWGLGLTIWGLLLVFAHAQLKQPSGRLSRYLVQTASLATISSLPIVVYWYWIYDREQPIDIAGIQAFAVTLYSLHQAILAVSVVRSSQSDVKLPEAERQEMTAAVTRIAQSMGMSPPELCCTSSDDISASASGGIAPQILVTSGFVYRLSPSERAAILAHELAHYINGTNLWFHAIIPITGCLVIWAWDDVLWMWAPWGWLCVSALYCVVSRRLEYDADRRAAQTTHPRDFVTALTKTCAEMPYAESGWMSRLAQAWSTHPTLDQRVEAIQQAFRQEFGPYVPSERVRQQRVADAILAVFWVVILSGTALWSRPGVRDLIAQSVLTIALCSYGVVQQRAYGAEYQRDLSSYWGDWRQPLYKSRVLWILVLCAIGIALDTYPPADGGIASRTFPAILILLVGILEHSGRGWKDYSNDQRAVFQAAQNKQWRHVIRLFGKLPPRDQKVYEVRVQLAVAHWMDGDVPDSLRILQEMIIEFPDRTYSDYLLWALQVELDDWNSANRVAHEYLNRTQGDPLAHCLVARGHVQAGRLTEATAQLEIARQLPDCNWAIIHGIEARILSSQGDRAAAWGKWQAADDTSPGNYALRLLAAELCIAEGNFAIAAKHLENVELQIQSLPIGMVERRTQTLQQLCREKLAESGSTTAASPSSAS